MSDSGFQFQRNTDGIKLSETVSRRQEFFITKADGIQLTEVVDLPTHRKFTDGTKLSEQVTSPTAPGDGTKLSETATIEVVQTRTVTNPGETVTVQVHKVIQGA